MTTDLVRELESLVKLAKRVERMLDALEEFGYQPNWTNEVDSAGIKFWGWGGDHQDDPWNIAKEAIYGEIKT